MIHSNKFSSKSILILIPAENNSAPIPWSFQSVGFYLKRQYQRPCLVQGFPLNFLFLYGIWDDFASQDGLLISPDLWRKYYKPWHKKIIEEAKKYKHITQDSPPENILAMYE